MSTGQRPKLEPYTAEGGRPPHLFLIVRMIQLVDGELESEQISMFVGKQTVVTFQEAPGDIWDPIRARIEKPGSRLRELDASYLAYTLLDAIVDHCFPVLEHYGDRLEELEDLVLDRPDRDTITEIHEVKRRAAAPAPRRLADARGRQRDAARAARVHDARSRAPTCATSTTTSSRSWTSSRPTARSARA